MLTLFEQDFLLHPKKSSFASGLVVLVHLGGIIANSDLISAFGGLKTALFILPIRHWEEQRELSWFG